MKSRFRRAALLFVSLLASAPTIAHAQASTLSPPKLTASVEAEYPVAAREAGVEASVGLFLVIGTDGNVHSVEIATPAGNGFDEAAVAAATRFHFDPAMKDGAPIAARIRYRYTFEMKALVPVTGNLEGRVVPSEGDAPLEGAELAVTAPDGTLLRAFTSSAGTFSLSGLAPGTYPVHVSTLDHADADSPEEVVAGEATAVTYRLEAVESGDVLAFGAVAKVDAPPRVARIWDLGIYTEPLPRGVRAVRPAAEAGAAGHELEGVARRRAVALSVPAGERARVRERTLRSRPDAAGPHQPAEERGGVRQPSRRDRRGDRERGGRQWNARRPRSRKWDERRDAGR